MRPSENGAIHELVQTIADETFAHLFNGQVPIGETNWHLAWLAILGDEIVGVTMTQDEWVGDLWVRKDSRRIGIGARLPAEAEREIRNRGHDKCRLRVVKSNTVAVWFYQSHAGTFTANLRMKNSGMACLSRSSRQRTIPLACPKRKLLIKTRVLKPFPRARSSHFFPNH
jgi:GNAT superfamily N-acetyltransferase